MRAADPRSTVIAFSDANSSWEPGALRELVASLADPAVGYACGQVRFVNAEDGTNQEGLYWRWEMWIRANESRLASVTGGNGAIYAVRREDYLEVDPGHGPRPVVPVQLRAPRPPRRLRRVGARDARRWSRPPTARSPASGG